MRNAGKSRSAYILKQRMLWIAGVIMIALAMAAPAYSDTPGQRKPQRPQLEPGRVTTLLPDTIDVAEPLPEDAAIELEMLNTAAARATLSPIDTVAIAGTGQGRVFNPDPSRAVWLSVLCPGLGQLYNRRFWKLPIVIGGFMGLGYATSWNNNMLRDYTRAYADLMDNDPNTNSYMDFFPSTTNEADLNTSWLANTFKSRKDFYRRNRDLCIIAMVGVYLLAIVDAYVDATLTHFDISPNLSMDVNPALMQDQRGIRPGIGLQWALNF